MKNHNAKINFYLSRRKQRIDKNLLIVAPKIIEMPPLKGFGFSLLFFSGFIGLFPVALLHLCFYSDITNNEVITSSIILIGIYISSVSIVHFWVLRAFEQALLTACLVGSPIKKSIEKLIIKTGIESKNNQTKEQIC